MFIPQIRPTLELLTLQKKPTVEKSSSGVKNDELLSPRIQKAFFA